MTAPSFVSDTSVIAAQVDGWAEFRAPARVGVLVRELRQGIATLLQQKIENPSSDLAHAPIVDAMHQLLATDGF